MQMPIRRVSRLVLGGWLGLAGLGLFTDAVRAAAPPEKALPGSTILFVKVNNATGFREALRQSQFGQLWSDPAMKPLKDDLSSKLNDSNNRLKGALGVSIEELLQLPQGPVSLGVVTREGAKPPVAALISADAGKNDKVMQDVLSKAGKLADQKGNAKVSTESFKGMTLNVLRSTKEEDKDAPPIVWTNQGTVYHFGTDVDALKDLLSNAEGRSGSLADGETFGQIKGKVGEDSQAIWFLDVAQGLNLASKVMNAAGGGQGQQIEAMLQLSGLNGLKAVGGTLTMNTGVYDTLTKTFVLAPAPAKGLLKVFAMPKVSLRPEPWVPGSVASYETISWDLDAAYAAVDELANMLNPGLLNVLQQQLVGPNGGEPLNFQKDIFGPLGDRITIISDFKKKSPTAQPKDKATIEDNQRTLFAVALEDVQAFGKTLNKLIAMSKANPKKRDFQGTTIYDFDVPNMPNAGAGGGVAFKGPVSVAMAKNTLFVSLEPTILELVLRGSGPRLADSAEFQAIAKEIPDQTSTLSYARPEESIRQFYDMVKSGQLRKALEQAAVAGAPDAPKMGDLIDTNKLPEFSVISKYLSQGGGYGMMNEDGFYTTSFSLRKVNP